MFRTFVIVLICGGFAFAAWRISTYFPETGSVATPSPSAPETPETAETAQAPAEPAPPPVDQPGNAPSAAVRNVTPEGVFTGPVALSRPPEATEEAPAQAEPPKSKRYFRVLVADAGTLRSGNRTIRLAGIAAPASEATCRDDAGTEWPCGRAAKAALTLFLRGRAIDCETVSSSEAAITATCRSGDEDLAAWLVAQGWARPAGGDAYREAAARAERERLGLHQAEWRSGAARPGTSGRTATSIVQD